MARASAFLLVSFLLALPACDRLDATRAEEERAAARAEQLRAEREARRLELEPKTQQAKIDALVAQLASAKDDATRLALQKQLEAERARSNKPTGPSPAGSGKPACQCAPGDPLCSCH